MREIKFRAWDTERQMMAFNVHTEYDTIGDAIYSDGTEPVCACFMDYIKGENWIAMQYTGLKDKNEKEIYEGDILSVDGILNDDFVVEVKWDTGSFTASRPDTNENGTIYHYARLAHWAKEGIEVIGNIYQNENFLTDGN